MKQFLTRFGFCLLTILVVFTSCREDEISRPLPGKHPDQSQGHYEKYLNALKEAYAEKNDFAAAMQLANLKAEPGTVFPLLELAINSKSENCSKIYHAYYLYDRHNFGINLLKIDTTRFKHVVQLCNQLLDTTSYEAYAAAEDESERIASENQKQEDTTNFNMVLYHELQQMYKDDQDIRHRISKKNITAEEERTLREEMSRIDSINLIKVDRILREHGYPSQELVGRDGNFTPALVIHHSAELETRYKYLPMLEKAVNEGVLGEGTLKMIKRRIEDLELSKQK